MKKILVVDDEIQILKSISRTLSEMDYEILTAENGTVALKLLETNHIDMVISDMRMPMMNGYELLTIVKEKYPKIIRIILSGYADEKLMFRALLHNLAKLYIFKPWNNNEFLESINKLFIDDVVLNSDHLIKMIDDTQCSSCMPHNCKKLISLIQEENIDTLITEMEKDFDISALLLQVSKTAIYGVMPNNTKQAALYIGLPNLKSFMYWACIASGTKHTDDINTKPEILWTHSYLTNRIFLFLYETFFFKQPPEAALFAGLLHNLGLIILTEGLQKKGQISKSELTADDYIRMELVEYEVHHQEIGAHFLDLWDLTFPVYEVALYHHRPLDSCIIHHELVSCVHIAQNYAWRQMKASAVEQVQPEVFEALGISVDDFEKRLARYLKS